MKDDQLVSPLGGVFGGGGVGAVVQVEDGLGQIIREGGGCQTFKIKRGQLQIKKCQMRMG